VRPPNSRRFRHQLGIKVDFCDLELALMKCAHCSVHFQGRTYPRRDGSQKGDSRIAAPDDRRHQGISAIPRPTQSPTSHRSKSSTWSGKRSSTRAKSSHSAPWWWRSAPVLEHEPRVRREGLPSRLGAAGREGSPRPARRPGVAPKRAATRPAAFVYCPRLRQTA